MKKEANTFSGDVNDDFPVAVRRCLVAAFSGGCAMGFAIFDDRLRYEDVNNCLAAIHVLPAREHLVHTVEKSGEKLVGK